MDELEPVHIQPVRHVWCPTPPVLLNTCTKFIKVLMLLPKKQFDLSET